MHNKCLKVHIWKLPYVACHNVAVVIVSVFILFVFTSSTFYPSATTCQGVVKTDDVCSTRIMVCQGDMSLDLLSCVLPFNFFKQ